MKLLRSAAGVIVGVIVALVCMSIAEAVNGHFHPPPDGMGMSEFQEEMQNGTDTAKAWMQSIPTRDMALLLSAWCVGGMLGGATSAWIAGRARLVHAGIIGAFVLSLMIVNLLVLKYLLEYSLPDGLLVVALLLPMPLSLLGGLIVAKLTTPSQPPAPEQA